MKSRIIQTLSILIALTFSLPATAGDVDVGFVGGDPDSPTAISGETTPGSDKTTLEFKGDDVTKADAMFASILDTIETSAPFTGTASAQIVFKDPEGDRVVDVEFSTLDYDGKLYLFAELGDGTALVWTKAKY